ncbi:hypothetical protein BDBG_16770 [Blastomyces gilchristii SLH14081]|uniref:Uncharacterized protein n=1 Tax=Blastomyces gilchristii (strain SLH14081) TaxID=559298 RepID=A0A179UH00_BLAGS|nr:uncharacterized protein BDBG_16770 [Blastomyces gilchristii SLH14081]OAT07130.1 hypothetical protein BDBG_16770 [Blastomyces gilchristii SLH14081]
MLTALALFSLLNISSTLALQMELEQSVFIDASKPPHTTHKVNSNHTLTQSSLQSPCTPLQQFDSGFTRFNPSNRSGLLMSFTVNSLNSQ